jgi:hypothetical protein
MTPVRRAEISGGARQQIFRTSQRGGLGSLAEVVLQCLDAGMSYAPKIVLKLPMANPHVLASFVEACLKDGVELIAVVGPDCENVHDLIDDFIIGDGSNDKRSIVTSWHTDEPFDEVLEFAREWTAKSEDQVQVVSL